MLYIATGLLPGWSIAFHSAMIQYLIAIMCFNFTKSSTITILQMVKAECE